MFESETSVIEDWESKKAPLKTEGEFIKNGLGRKKVEREETE